jgi:hypothetical protein
LLASQFSDVVSVEELRLAVQRKLTTAPRCKLTKHLPYVREKPIPERFPVDQPRMYPRSFIHEALSLAAMSCGRGHDGITPGMSGVASLSWRTILIEVEKSH